MDMKLSLLEGDELMGREDETRRRAERMTRQLARIEAWHGGGKGGGRGSSRGGGSKDGGVEGVTDSSGQLVGRAQQLQKLYKLKTEDLQLVRRFRESRKRALVGTLLKSNITNEFTIHPSFGTTMFFEYQLTNPYSHEERVTIDISDPELSVGECLLFIFNLYNLYNHPAHSAHPASQQDTHGISSLVLFLYIAPLETCLFFFYFVVQQIFLRNAMRH